MGWLKRNWVEVLYYAIIFSMAGAVGFAFGRLEKAVENPRPIIIIYNGDE